MLRRLDTFRGQGMGWSTCGHLRVRDLRHRQRVGDRPIERVRGLRRVRVEVEFGTDEFGVGVVEVVEDGQGLLPGVAGGVGVAGDVMGLWYDQENTARISVAGSPASKASSLAEFGAVNGYLTGTGIEGVCKGYSAGQKREYLCIF
jgi:hypothetical protein